MNLMFKKSRPLPLARIMLVAIVLVAITIISWRVIALPGKKAFADDGQGRHGATYLFQNRANGLCMDVGPAGNWYEGAHPYMYMCSTKDNLNPNQEWFSRGINDPKYNFSGTIESAVAKLPDGRKLCLDHANILNQEDFVPYLYHCYDGAGQAWSTFYSRKGEGSKGKEYGEVFPFAPNADSSDLSGDVNAHNGNVYFHNPSEGQNYSGDHNLQWKNTYVADATY